MTDKRKISSIKPHEETMLHNYENVGKMVDFLNMFWTIKVKPVGYDELKEGYEDFDGMEEFDPTHVLESFKGMESSTAGSFSFPEQLTAPQVVYGECCQGRSPLHSIVSAVFGYAFQCGAKHQELKYVKSFNKRIEFSAKMAAIIERTEDVAEQAKSYKEENESIIEDIKHKLYFDSEVTDHTQLDKIMGKEK